MLACDLCQLFRMPSDPVAWIFGRQCKVTGMPHGSIANDALCGRGFVRIPQQQLNRVGLYRRGKVLLSCKMRKRDRGGTGGKSQVILRAAGKMCSRQEVLTLVIRLGRLQTPGHRTTNSGQSARRGAVERCSKPFLVRDTFQQMLSFVHWPSGVHFPCIASTSRVHTFCCSVGCAFIHSFACCGDTDFQMRRPA